MVAWWPAGDAAPRERRPHRPSRRDRRPPRVRRPAQHRAPGPGTSCRHVGRPTDVQGRPGRARPRRNRSHSVALVLVGSCELETVRLVAASSASMPSVSFDVRLIVQPSLSPTAATVTTSPAPVLSSTIPQDPYTDLRTTSTSSPVRCSYRRTTSSPALAGPVRRRHDTAATNARARAQRHAIKEPEIEPERVEGRSRATGARALRPRPRALRRSPMIRTDLCGAAAFSADVRREGGVQLGTCQVVLRPHRIDPQLLGCRVPEEGPDAAIEHSGACPHDEMAQALA